MINTAVDCGELGNPVDGAVTFTAGTTFESIAEYSCNLGFLLIGSLRRTCQVDGQWSGSAPLCTPGKLINSKWCMKCHTQFLGWTYKPEYAGSILSSSLLTYSQYARTSHGPTYFYHAKVANRHDFNIKTLT